MSLPYHKRERSSPCSGIWRFYVSNKIQMWRGEVILGILVVGPGKNGIIKSDAPSRSDYIATARGVKASIFSNCSGPKGKMIRHKDVLWMFLIGCTYIHFRVAHSIRGSEGKRGHTGKDEYEYLHVSDLT